tara:strand:- start:451 stop:891 length:441 start_codon:yes stop_codon:yes gene_type:complete
MANPFDFSSGAVLTAAQLNAIGKGGDVTWSPTSNWSGTFSAAQYARVNDMIIVSCSLTLDATPSGILEIDPAPVAGHTTLSGVSGTGCMVDTSADNVHAVCPRYNSNGKIGFTTNAENDFATVTNTKPFTFASGDSIRFVMVYQAA